MRWQTQKLIYKPTFSVRDYTTCKKITSKAKKFCANYIKHFPSKLLPSISLKLNYGQRSNLAKLVNSSTLRCANILAATSYLITAPCWLNKTTTLPPQRLGSNKFWPSTHTTPTP